jgi:hypothetical protein
MFKDINFKQIATDVVNSNNLGLSPLNKFLLITKIEAALAIVSLERVDETMVALKQIKEAIIADKSAENSPSIKDILN